MAERTAERPRVLEYPFEYFDVQVQFAKKWSELTGQSLSQTLLKNTAIYRRIIGKWTGGELDENWELLCQKVEANPEKASAIIVNHYIKLPESIYVPHQHTFNSFEHDYYPDRKTVKVHYNPTIRGSRSNLGREFLNDRRSDLRNMFKFIKNQYPEATTVIGGSWLYSLEAYRRIFPPTYTQNMTRLIPPQMSFSGNSVWGQFMDSRGAPKKEICHPFEEKVAQAKTTDDLVNAFPFPTWQPSDDINNFYKFLDIIQK